MEALDAERLQRPEHRLGLAGVGVGRDVARPLRPAEAVEVGGDRPVSPRQGGHHQPPRMAGAAEAVQQHQRLAAARLLDVHELVADAHQLAGGEGGADIGVRPRAPLGDEVAHGTEPRGGCGDVPAWGGRPAVAAVIAEARGLLVAVPVGRRRPDSGRVEGGQVWRLVPHADGCQQEAGQL